VKRAARDLHADGLTTPHHARRTREPVGECHNTLFFARATSAASRGHLRFVFLELWPRAYELRGRIRLPVGMKTLTRCTSLGGNRREVEQALTLSWPANNNQQPHKAYPI